MLKLFVKKRKHLPDFFRPILWSYDFSAIDTDKHKEIIIINAINYGNLKHWRWLVSLYGKKTVAGILKEIPVTELRQPARRLASIIFSINDFNYVPRSVKR